MQTQHIREVYRKQDTSIVLVYTSAVYADLFQSDSVKTFYATIQPSWIVIRKPHKLMVLNMQSEQVPVDDVCDAIPELRTYLRDE